jgi:hypothetical protein
VDFDTVGVAGWGAGAVGCDTVCDSVWAVDATGAGAAAWAAEVALEGVDCEAVGGAGGAVGVAADGADGSVAWVTACTVEDTRVDVVAGATAVEIPSACASVATGHDSASTPAKIAVNRRLRAARARERGCLPQQSPLTAKPRTTQILSSTCNSD